MGANCGGSNGNGSSFVPYVSFGGLGAVELSRECEGLGLGGLGRGVRTRYVGRRDLGHGKG